jgi:hypothetical protein
MRPINKIMHVVSSDGKEFTSWTTEAAATLQRAHYEVEIQYQQSMDRRTVVYSALLIGRVTS